MRTAHSSRLFVLPLTALVMLTVIGLAGPSLAGSQKPNILVIFGDDIGQTNISAYSMRLMGYHTPSIHRIAKEGMVFTDYYAEQSCTAGRSSFITGRATLRTGLSKVGIPGEQRMPGTLAVWAEPFVPLRLPKLFDLRADPYERADITSNTYYDWVIYKGPIALAASAVVGKFLEPFMEFPPSQRPATFTIDQAMEKLKQNLGGN